MVRLRFRLDLVELRTDPLVRGEPGICANPCTAVHEGAVDRDQRRLAGRAGKAQRSPARPAGSANKTACARVGLTFVNSAEVDPPLEDVENGVCFCGVDKKRPVENTVGEEREEITGNQATFLNPASTSSILSPLQYRSIAAALNMVARG